MRTPKVTERELYKRDIADKLHDNRHLIVLVTLLSLTLALLYLLYTPKSYTSSGIIEITPRDNALHPSTPSPLLFSRYVDTQVELLQSRFMIDRVIERLGLEYTLYTSDKNGTLLPLKKAPIEIIDLNVKDPGFYTRKFALRDIDGTYYALTLYPSDGPHATLKYRYGALIDSDYLHMRVMKKRNFHGTLVISFIDAAPLIERITHALQVERTSPDTSMIKITYTAHTPSKAQRFVATMIRLYIEYSTKTNHEEYTRLIHLLDTQIALEKEKLDHASRQLESYTTHNKIAGIDTQTTDIVSRLSADRSKLKTQIARARTLRLLYRRFLQSYDYKSMLSELESLQNQGITSLLHELDALEARYNTLRLKYKPKHPQMVKLRQETHRLLRLLAQNLHSLTNMTERQIASLRERIHEADIHLSAIPSAQLHYDRLQKQYKTIEKSYFALLQKRKELAISQQMQHGPYRYRIIDDAYLPRRPSKPKKAITLLLGVLLGLFTGVLLALLKEYFAKTVRLPSEVTELTRHPYLGTIPYIEDRRVYSGLYLRHNPDSIGAQMIWSLRATLDFFLPKKGHNLIAVSSMVEGEGKTTVAANLATAFAMGDKRCAAVSFDLRASELHLKFNLPNDNGIADILFSDKSLDDVTYVSKQIRNLFVIPAGRTDRSPIQMINSKKIASLLKELRKRFDYVILDLPPVTVAAEALFLMKKADFSIIVLKAGYSRKEYVIDMEKITAKYKISHIGFVLNSVDKRYIRLLNRQENRKYRQMRAKLLQEAVSKEVDP